MEKSTKKGFAQARRITRQRAKTFYFASRFLPADTQRAACSVYAICRISDDSVDQVKNDPEKSLDAVKRKIEESYEKRSSLPPLLSAFRHTAKTHRIPKEYFDILLQGMRMDIEKNRYANFEELREYCYKVAGIVGLIMLQIFGYTDRSALARAADLGIAMQLTNIIRDVEEDLGRNRVYLPKDEMDHFNVSELDLHERKTRHNFRELLRYQIRRAREYYLRADAGIALIADRRSRFVTGVMKELYAGILDSVEKSNYRVFGQRAHVPLRKKILITSKLWITKPYDEN
ncbi:MAG: phytoene/squalene synthase family protein [Candidatus Omnitrophica bacterium]|nr:phytoene/squalene synthase family protein [Candidatus Omnitrophota bacterium]